jgi:hypothetical protein
MHSTYKIVLLSFKYPPPKQQQGLNKQRNNGQCAFTYLYHYRGPADVQISRVAVIRYSWRQHALPCKITRFMYCFVLLCTSLHSSGRSPSSFNTVNNKALPLDTNLSQFYPLPILTSYLPKIHLNVTLPTLSQPSFFQESSPPKFCMHSLFPEF